MPADGCAPIFELPTIEIGVFDPRQQIDNQLGISISIVDDGTIKTEIKPCNARSQIPAYVLIVDSIDDNHVNLDLDWFNPRSSDK